MAQTTDRLLRLPEGFDPATQTAVGLFLAQLDDQLRRLKEEIKGYEVAHLEWQPALGHNTAGALLAHMAVAEAYWMLVATLDNPPSFLTEPDRFRDEIGPPIQKLVSIDMDDDGLPRPPDGAHPQALAGKTLGDYFALLDKARAETRRILLGWNDASLADTYSLHGRDYSRAWTIYHVLEHFCGHFGQILLQRHLMRDAGDYPAEPETA